MSFDLSQVEGLDWLNSGLVRPYVYMRAENRFKQPGSFHHCDWFHQDVIFKDPMKMSEVKFADQILTLESAAFAKASLQMPRWVFYDCAVMPGVVCGFAQKTSSLSNEFCQTLKVNPELEWTPISLFIIIPTIRRGEWVAHNLCTANALVGEKDQHYALGFLTKAFGLWYANVEILCGMTQWQSPAIRLHSNYGPFEVLTAYTPVHSYARTLTYRSRINVDYWSSFFEKTDARAPTVYEPAGTSVDPKSDQSLIEFQSNIESGTGPYYLSPAEIRNQPLDAPLKVYRLAKGT